MNEDMCHKYNTSIELKKVFLTPKYRMNLRNASRQLKTNVRRILKNEKV